MIVETGALGWKVRESGKSKYLMAREFWLENVVENSRAG